MKPKELKLLLYDRHSSFTTSVYTFSSFFCYENELVICLSETGQRDSFHRSGIRKNKGGMITVLGMVLPYTVEHTTWRKDALKIPEIKLLGLGIVSKNSKKL